MYCDVMFLLFGFIWCIYCMITVCASGQADAKIPDMKLRKEIAPEAGHHQGSWL